jgi:hypothetical protein
MRNVEVKTPIGMTEWEALGGTISCSRHEFRMQCIETAGCTRFMLLASKKGFGILCRGFHLHGPCQIVFTFFNIYFQHSCMLDHCYL